MLCSFTSWILFGGVGSFMVIKNNIVATTIKKIKIPYHVDNVKIVPPNTGAIAGIEPMRIYPVPIICAACFSK
ncbi:hypothetical protein LA02_356 [Francisella philomiragia]|nr:hypothetical protein LA02_356 [Francisella philomiragia]